MAGALEPGALATSLHQATSLLVSPAMAETTTATLVAAVALALHEGRDMADAVEIGHRGAAEFHRNLRHGFKSSRVAGDT